MVTADDNCYNTLNTNYSFTVMDDPYPPYLVNANPTNNEIDVAPDTDIYLEIFDNTDVNSNSIVIKVSNNTAFSNGVFQPGFTGTITPISTVSASSGDFQVSIGSDDADEDNNDGTVNIVSPALAMVDSGPINQTVGIRFQNVTVPQGATITTAYLEFVANGGSVGAISLTILGEDSDNAATFVAVKSNISDRTVTSATASWNPPDWTDGGTYQSSDISSVVKEIVDRGGWTISNAMVFIIRGPDETRIAYSYDGSVANAPVLHVEWTSSGGSDSGYAVNINPDNDLPWGATIPVNVSANDLAANTLTTNYSFKIMDATNVHNVTKNIWYDTITNAMAEASNNNLIEVHPGTYNEGVLIGNFTNLTIRAWDWTNSTNNTTTIVDATGFENAFMIQDSETVTIQGFSITKASSNGITILGTSFSNYIKNNNIYSNDLYGIYINSDTADNNQIISNNVYGLNQDTGVYIGESDNNLITENTLSKNQNNGLWVEGSSTNNTISHNNCNSNTARGIFLNNNTLNNYIYTNTCIGQNNGIVMMDDNESKVIGNTVKENSAGGVWIQGSTNFLLQYNDISFNLASEGIVVMDSTGDIELNTIFSNKTGIAYGNANNVNITKNNISNNTNVNLDNLAGIPAVITNNWWGSTIVSTILAGINNNGTYSNFTPYRLFGEFDITPGADTDTPDIVTNVQASPFNGTNVAISWSAVTNSDLVRYFVYRNDINDTTNITPAVHWVGQSLTTSFTESGVNSGTNWYYFVTALDNHPVYTNESWYSAYAMVIAGEPLIRMTKTVSPTNGVRPYDVLSYSIKYTNSGDAAASVGLNIIEELPPNALLMTNSAEISNSIHAGSVTVYYSTNLSGNWWTNSNYDSAATVDKIKRVRWVFSANTSVGTNGILRFKVLIK